MNLGCTQGSVLGPIIWNLKFDKLLEREFLENSQPIAFAEDVAFVISGDARREIEAKGNEICEDIQDCALRAK